MDYQDLHGMEHVKRAVEIAVTGSFGLILIGAAGSGKTAVTDRLLSIQSSEGQSIPFYGMRPCPCGNFTHPTLTCGCTSLQIQKHLDKHKHIINQLELDRHLLHVEVPCVDWQNTPSLRGEASSTIRRRIRKNQKEMLGGIPNRGPTGVPTLVSPEAEELLKTAILELGISAKCYTAVLSIAGVIAVMDGEVGWIQTQHISEAVGYRALDRNLWAT